MKEKAKEWYDCICLAIEACREKKKSIDAQKRSNAQLPVQQPSSHSHNNTSHDHSSAQSTTSITSDSSRNNISHVCYI
jgi:hypothetical protein